MIEQTLGQKRVGVSFNPSNNPKIDEIKTKAAELIDLINSIKDENDSFDVARWKSLAFTEIETGAMYGVKAAANAG